MLGQSRLLFGLLNETSGAVAAQVELWDRSTVWQAAWDQASKNAAVKTAAAYVRENIGKQVTEKVRETLSEVAPDWYGQPEAKNSSDQNPLDGHIMKFCRMLDHAGLRLEQAPNVVELHDLGLQIERDAVRVLGEADDRTLMARLRREPRKGFQGTTTDDLVRHVIQKMFEQLDTEFQSKSPKEQEEIAARISAALRDLPPAEQERIRKAARLPDLTAETLRQTGALSSLGFGLSSIVHLAGFAAYTTLTHVTSVVLGVVGVHLQFATYKLLTSSLFMVTHAPLLVPALAMGGGWIADRANRSIRSILYPTLVATSVMALAASEEHDLPLGSFTARVGQLIDEIQTASGYCVAMLGAKFPALGRATLSAHVASHVVT